MKKYKSPMQTAYRKPVVLDSNDPRNKNAFELEKFRSRIGADVIVRDFKESTIELEEYSQGDIIVFAGSSNVYSTINEFKNIKTASSANAYFDINWMANLRQMIYNGKYFVGHGTNIEDYSISYIYFVLPNLLDISLLEINNYSTVYSMLYANNKIFVSVIEAPFEGPTETKLLVCTNMNDPFEEGAWNDYAIEEVFNSISYGDSKYIALSDNDAYTSTDGTSWTATETGEYGKQIIFWKNNFITNRLRYSSDGNEWNDCTLDIEFIPSGSSTCKITIGNNAIIITGQTSTEEGNVGNVYAISYDGINWEVNSIPSEDTSIIYSSFFANGKFYAFAFDDASQPIYSSSNGINWTALEDLPGSTFLLSSSRDYQSDYLFID